MKNTVLKKVIFKQLGKGSSPLINNIRLILIYTFVVDSFHQDIQVKTLKQDVAGYGNNRDEQFPREVIILVVTSWCNVSRVCGDDRDAGVYCSASRIKV